MGSSQGTSTAECLALAHLLASRTSVSPNDVTYLSFLVAVLAAFGYVSASLGL